MNVQEIAAGFTLNPSKGEALSLRSRLSERSLIEPNSGCWIWEGASDERGYGRIGSGKRVLRTNRASYASFIGSIPAGVHVLHKCDTPACVNPDHLFLGTHSENMRDCVRKGRHTPPRLVGENNPMAEVSKEDIVSAVDLAEQIGIRPAGRKLGIPESTIRSWVRGERRVTRAPARRGVHDGI